MYRFLPFLSPYTVWVKTNSKTEIAHLEWTYSYRAKMYTSLCLGHITKPPYYEICSHKTWINQRYSTMHLLQIKCKMWKQRSFREDYCFLLGQVCRDASFLANQVSFSVTKWNELSYHFLKDHIYLCVSFFMHRAQFGHQQLLLTTQIHPSLRQLSQQYRPRD